MSGSQKGRHARYSRGLHDVAGETLCGGHEGLEKGGIMPGEHQVICRGEGVATDGADVHAWTRECTRSTSGWSGILWSEEGLGPRLEPS